MLARAGIATGAVLGLSAMQVTKVNAAEEPQQKKKVRPCELPVYGEPEPHELEYVPEWETAFHRKVSEGRKWAWSYLDSAQDSTDRVKQSFSVAQAHTADLLQYIQEDSGVLVRASIITVSGLGGIVAGYRGGVIRKTFLAATTMAAAASVCYPNQALVVGKEGWRLASDFASVTYSDLTGSSDEKKKPSKTQDKKQKTESTEKPDTNPSESGPKKDFGMSKPEDRDMYTTRGS